MTVNFQYPLVLLALGLLPAVAALYFRATRRHAVSSALFTGGLPSELRAIRAARFRHRMQLTGFSIAFVCLVLALARPGWRPRQEALTKSGRDVVFLLDVSRSMLAEDRVPNRLENMRVAILDCVDTFRGNRVALAVFAGTPAIRCPLTSDYEFFRKTLAGISPRSTSHGGTRVGDALHKVADKLLLDDMEGFQDIVLITDGGDHRSRPADAVSALNDKRAGLVVIGVGAVDRESRIPIVDPDSGKQSYLQYESHDVLTRQDKELLQGLVQSCDNGLYLDGSTRPVDLANVYEQFAAHMDQRVFTTENVETYEEEFPVFVGLALLGLLIAGFAPCAAARRLERATTAVAAVMLIVFAQTVPAAGRNMRNEAHAAYERGEFAGAEELLRTACYTAAALAEVFYDHGNALYRMGEYTNAVVSYSRALAVTDHNEIQFRCCYNMGICRVLAAEDSSVEEADRAMHDLDEAVRCFRAALAVRPASEDAAWNLECALHRRQVLERERRLRAAMEKNKQQAESESSEGHASRSAHADDDIVGQEIDADMAAAMADQASSARAGALDLESRTLPPPNISPEDVLREEAEINALREKTGGPVSAKVKKDW